MIREELPEVGPATEAVVARKFVGLGRAQPTHAARRRAALEAFPTGGHAKDIGAWQQAMRRTLWELAPWQLKQHAMEPLALLPHQIHQVKAWIGWGRDVICIRSTANNERMAEHKWKRSTDFDLARLAIARTTTPTSTSKTETTVSAKTKPSVKTKPSANPKPSAKLKPSAKPKAKPAAPAKTAASALPKAKKQEAQPGKPFADYFRDKLLWGVKTGIAHAKRRPAADAMKDLLEIVDDSRGGKWGYDRANALFAAIEVARPSDGPIFTKYLSDKHDFVVRAAIDGVKKLKYADAVPALARVVIDHQAVRAGGSRYHAASALKTLSGIRGPKGLLQYFEHQDPRVREAACFAAAKFSDGHKLYMPYLEQAKKDADKAVVSAAGWAMKEIAEEKK